MVIWKIPSGNSRKPDFSRSKEVNDEKYAFLDGIKTNFEGVILWTTAFPWICEGDEVTFCTFGLGEGGVEGVVVTPEVLERIELVSLLLDASKGATEKENIRSNQDGGASSSFFRKISGSMSPGVHP